MVVAGARSSGLICQVPQRVLFNLAVAKNVPPDNIITKFLIKINHMNIGSERQSLLFWINYRIATAIWFVHMGQFLAGLGRISGKIDAYVRARACEEKFCIWGLRAKNRPARAPTAGSSIWSIWGVQGPDFGIFLCNLHKKPFENLFIMTIDFPEIRAMGTIVGPPF